MQVSGSDDVFTAGMQAMVQLSAVVGPALNPHLKILLSSVSHVLVSCFFNSYHSRHVHSDRTELN